MLSKVDRNVKGQLPGAKSLTAIFVSIKETFVLKSMFHFLIVLYVRLAYVDRIDKGHTLHILDALFFFKSRAPVDQPRVIIQN